MEGVAALRPMGSASLRAWFVSYVLWLGLLAGGALLGLRLWNAGDLRGLQLWAVCVGAFYLSLCNSLLPLPTPWVVMLLASDVVGLPGPILGRIGFVAGVTALATGMANLNEYHVLRWLMHSRLARKIRSARVVQWAIRWFRISPFTILATAAFVPIPVDAVRWLAIADGYSRWRYFWAYCLGRGARYALLAAATVWLAFGPQAIALVQVSLLAAAGLLLAWRAARRR